MSDSQQNNEIISASEDVPKKTTRQRLLAILIILVLLGIGVVGAISIIKTRPQAKRQKTTGKMQTFVSVIKVAPQSVRVEVKGYGTVIPARSIHLQARVSGTVTSLHPEFIPGGLVNKGDILVRLDDNDYKLVLTQKQNILTQRQADLRLEEGSQEVAKKEWQMVSQFTDMEESVSKDIVLREPQLAKTMANINLAMAEVEKARIDLERTVIRAPFDGVVSAKNIDTGSQVSPQASIGTLIDIRSFWAEISVPTERLQWFTLPDNSRNGSTVILTIKDSIYKGQVIKLLPELEKNGLMARLLVEIKDPYNQSGKTPLLLGSFANATIQGKNITDVYKIPRLAMKDNSVHTVTQDNTLHIQPVSVAWINADSVFINKGLEENSRIITTNIPGSIEGMELKVAGSGTKMVPKKSGAK